jgi:hypothetical protein
MKRKKIGRARNVAHVGEMTNTHNSLDKKSEGKRSLGGHKHRWDGNIKTDIK